MILKIWTNRIEVANEEDSNSEPDITTLDLIQEAQKVKPYLDLQEDPPGWNCFSWRTTSAFEVMEGFDPVTTRQYAVPFIRNGLEFVVTAEVVYDHLYHTVDVSWTGPSQWERVKA